jgi:fatty-acyl-CoA synthase
MPTQLRTDAPRSYASGPSGTPLLGETIDANLRRAVAGFADREALVDVVSGRRLTYAQLDAAVDDVARGLLARGVEKGDRVGT